MSKTIRPLQEAQKVLYNKQQELAEFVKANTNAYGEYTFSAGGIKAFNDRNAELEELCNEVEQARAIDSAMARSQEVKALTEIERRYPFPAASTNGAVKGIGDYFVESEGYKAFRQASGRPVEYAVEIPSHVLSATKATTTTATALPYPMQQPGVIGYPTRRPVVADLIPQSDSDQPAIVYLEQTTQSFGAAPTAEADLKQESTFGWTRHTLPFEVIAHWTKVTNQAMEDIPSLRDRLNELMGVGLQLAEEDQILNGNGTTPQLQGFLTKSGVQTQAKGSDDVFTAFLAALTKVRFTGRATPTGAIFHPNDWQTLLTTKTTNGRFIFGDPALIQQTQTLWGVPYVVTDAMTENTSLVGDFASYSRLYRKNGIRLLVGTEGDDLKRNIQTMVVEERVALEIGRASAFCKLTGI